MDGVGKKDRKVERNKEAQEHFHIYSHSWREKEEGDRLSWRESRTEQGRKDTLTIYTRRIRAVLR